MATFEKYALALSLTWEIDLYQCSIRRLGLNGHLCGSRSRLHPLIAILRLAGIDPFGEHALVFPCRRAGKDTWIDALTRRGIEVQPTRLGEWFADADRSIGGRFFGPKRMSAAS